MTTKRALLFDIDGTLTKSGGAGARALATALGAKMRAAEELRNMRLDGMTDRSIVRLLLAAENPDRSRPITERAAAVEAAQIDALLGPYLDALAVECAARSYVTQPGVPALIAALKTRDDVILGLCTGNLERGAQLKIDSSGLDFSTFRFGGYGSDSEARPEIVKLAWKKAQALGAADGLVIGDTPRDVLAAHEAGLPCCGVATGRWTVHDLAENGADAIVESFADLPKTLSILLGALAVRKPG